MNHSKKRTTIRNDVKKIKKEDIEENALERTIW